MCLHKKMDIKASHMAIIPPHDLTQLRQLNISISFFLFSSFTSYLPPTLFSPYCILVYVCGWVCVTVICSLELNKTVRAQEKKMGGGGPG